MDPTTSITCPLCRHHDTTLFCTDKRRGYHLCEQCSLVFVPSEQHLARPAEKANYDLHRNDPNDHGYRQFLSRLADPLTAKLQDGAQGLDYGSGPGPTLPAMLRERGYSVRLYDPLYFVDPDIYRLRYDFITCSEVVEHFRHPQHEFQRLFSMLNRGGLLGIMTKRVIDAAAFARWHYKNDLTHVSFFSIPTFQWLAKHYHCRVEFFYQDVAIFQV